MWAYDDGSGLAGQAGSFGMVLVAQSGTPLRVSYTNLLPDVYPGWIPVDPRLTHGNGRKVRPMTHLHGGFVAADSDGNPVTDAGTGYAPGQKPVTETPTAGTVEDWVWVNMTPDTHPMHVHLVTFQVVGRTPFDVNAYQKGSPGRRATYTTAISWSTKTTR